jgi:hypothetical protein
MFRLELQAGERLVLTTDDQPRELKCALRLSKGTNPEDVRSERIQ